MSAALTRRAALRGSAAAALGLAAGAAPMLATAASLDPADARLVALETEYKSLDAAVSATHSLDPGYEALLERYLPLEEEMADTPAASLAGVMAKARTMQIPTCRDCGVGVAESIADDLMRLFGGGADA